MPQPVRSILAVLAGFLTKSFVAGTLMAISFPLFHLKYGAMTPHYMGFDMGYSLCAAVLGGWLTATIARHAPIVHGAVLGLVIFAFSLLSLFRLNAKQNLLFLTCLFIAPPLAAVLGSALARPSIPTA